jgi:hypothetical protein
LGFEIDDGAVFLYDSQFDLALLDNGMPLLVEGEVGEGMCDDG